MCNAMLPRHFPLVRMFAAAVLIFSELAIAVWAAQDPAKPGAQQDQTEPGKSKQTGRKPKEEEEETRKPLRKVPLRVGDEDLEENQPASTRRPGTFRTADLEREAKRAKHPAVQELFNGLAKPHDVVTMSNLKTWNVEPIPEYLADKAKVTKLSLRPFNDAWKPGNPFSLTSTEIKGVEPYEHLALRKVSEFLKSGLERDRESKQYLPRLEMLQEAEKALTAVLLFHDSAVERGLRKGNAWNDVRKQLTGKLQEVQLDQLRALADQKSWDAAFELAGRLAEAYPGQDVQANLVKTLAESIRDSLKSQDYGRTHQRLFFLESQFPNSAELESIRNELRSRAANIMVEATKLEKLNQTKAALQRLDVAREIYPQLPGLRDFYLRLSNKNPVLYVGVHDIPEYISPATACLPSEKQAVEFLFEGLVRLTYSSREGQRYLPCLASDLPKIVPLGRQFSLMRGTYWSDGRALTAPDIGRTIDWLSAHLPECAELLGRPRIEEDSFHIVLTLRQGYLDPLSLMTFKVLPAHLGRQPDDAKFAKRPVGSGPYQLQARDAGSAIFAANPYYEMRPGKSGLPRIRAVHFFRSEDPVQDFQQGHLHLLLDLPTSRYKELSSAPLNDVTLKTLPNRRIYFLAVNHRGPLLGNNVALRRAIAYAINREEILNDCFRAGLTRPPHRPLNGPYPLGSWACNPGVKADLYNADLAKAYALTAKGGRATLGRLTLKYPDGDPAVAKACKEIQKQVQSIGAGIELELKPVAARQLRRDVEELHYYDLAYYSWDYPDETYWLWPLFDPAGATQPGGRNFLGYRNDEDLEKPLREIMSHRDLAEIKKRAHSVHDAFYDKMPFIPLWQLDTHLAIHKSLSMVDGHDNLVEPDPLLIFTSVETWTLNQR